MLSKNPLCSAIVEVGISRESVDEVQHLLTSPTTRLIPDQVSQYTGSDSETDRRDGAQLARRRERPGSQQKQGSRQGETYLVSKCRSAQDGIAMPEYELKNGIHWRPSVRTSSAWATTRSLSASKS